MNFLRNASAELWVAIAGALLAGIGLLIITYRKMPKKSSRKRNLQEWRSIRQMLPDRDNWPIAIIKADDLLDKVMKSRRKDGKTMGERLVASQKSFSNNDAIWRAHKLANKLRESDNLLEVKLRESEVKKALLAIGQGMKDLGAL